jgi:Tfp pilus assembly protein PilV
MPIKETGKVASGVIEAMKSTPLALALLIVNVGFLGFAGYILGEVAENARERNHVQLELVSKLVNDIRDCRTNDKQPQAKSMLFKSVLGMMP